MKKYIIFLIVMIVYSIIITTNCPIIISNNVDIYNLLLNITVVTFTIIALVALLNRIKQDVIVALYNHINNCNKDINLKLDNIITANKVLYKQNETIGNNIIHTIITDSKLHYEKSIALLNNNLIETHTTHELLKELFMLENDTNTIIKSNLTVSSEMLDAIIESMVEDNILHLDKTLEESFIDNKIIPKEKNSRTINRRKKQQP